LDNEYSGELFSDDSVKIVVINIFCLSIAVKNNEELNSDRKIKMKCAYEKRSYSLFDKERRNLYEKDNHSEFIIRKQNTRGNNAEFSIRRSKSEYNKEQIIPKYYSSPSFSPSTTPINFQKEYKFNNGRRLNHGFSETDINKSSEKLYNKEKNGEFYNLNMKNVWSDEGKESSGKKNKKIFFLKQKV